jgi:hypothetical protein
MNEKGTTTNTAKNIVTEMNQKSVLLCSRIKFGYEGDMLIPQTPSPSVIAILK